MGYLIDTKENIVDDMGRIVIHHDLLDLRYG